VSVGRWHQTQYRVQAVAEGLAEYGFVLYPARGTARNRRR